MNHSEIRKFFLPFFKSSDLGFESKKFFLQFLIEIFCLGSGSVDLPIFVDLNPGSQNLANPDPKHWISGQVSWVRPFITQDLHFV